MDLQPMWRIATETVEPQTLAIQVLLSGLFHYLNNEVMFLALDNVHPITLAVGNTAKRVFIIVASLVRCVRFCGWRRRWDDNGPCQRSPHRHPQQQLVFRNPITATGAVGSAMAIGGTAVYSLVKQHYDSQK